MRYIPTTPAQQEEMLRAIGASSIEALLARIPTRARLTGSLRLPPAMAEADLIRHMQGLADQNSSLDEYVSFLGGGAYDHHVPSAINHLLLRGEFLTAYTPYQPEASQGTLRSIYEYQTMVCELTGMEVANASIYDGGSALAEAALMAHAVTDRPEILVSRGVHSFSRRVTTTYCQGAGLRITEVPWSNGVTDLSALEKGVSEKTAGVLLQYPNFFGCLEELEGAAEIA